MLTRRINKEKRLKQQKRDAEEAQRRENVKKMNVGLAKAFQEMIKKKQTQTSVE